MDKEKQIDEYKAEINELKQRINDAEEFFNVIPDAIVLVDERLTIKQINPGFSQLFIYEASEVLNESVEILFSRVQDWQDLIYNRRDQKTELEFKKKDGSCFTGEINLHPLIYEPDNLKGYSLIIRDITKQKKYKEDLEFQSMLIDKIEDTITATDLAGNITYVNEAECRAFNKSRTELIGRNVAEYGEDGEYGATQEEIKNKTIADGKWSGKIVNLKDNGERIYYETRTQLLYDEAGNPAGMVGISTDVTKRQRVLMELEESETLFKTIFEQSATGIAQLSHKGDHIQVNKTYCEITGYSPEEFENLNFQDITYSEDLDLELEQIRRLKNEMRDKMEYVKRIEHKDGRVISVQVYANIVRDKAREAKYIILSMIDITRQRADAERLLSMSTRLTLAVESAEIGIWELDIKKNVLYWDDRMHQIYGMSKAEFGGNYEAWKERFHPEDLEKTDIEVQQAISGEKDLDAEFRVVWPDKSVHYVKAFALIERVSGEPVHMIGINYDITKVKIDEKQLKYTLAEKSTLLRELYHRTKNNMQVISSMLDLEALSNNDENVRRTFNEMGNRIQTMSMVHHKLYQSQNLSKIDLGEYIKELTELLLASNYSKDQKISVSVEIQPIEVLIDTAIPCGLIINELISNSMKYAFTESGEGEIRLELFKEEDMIHLRYRDNGKGMPPDFDLQRDSNLGLLLVRKLSKDQLRGLSRFDFESGFGFETKFSDDYYKERV